MLQIDNSHGDHFLTLWLFSWFMSWPGCGAVCSASQSLQRSMQGWVRQGASPIHHLHKRVWGTFVIIRHVHLQNVSAFVTHLSSLGNENKSRYICILQPAASCAWGIKVLSPNPAFITHRKDSHLWAVWNLNHESSSLDKNEIVSPQMAAGMPLKRWFVPRVNSCRRKVDRISFRKVHCPRGENNYCRIIYALKWMVKK